MLFELLVIAQCLIDAAVADAEDDGGDEQRHHEFDQREAARARAER